MSVSLAGFAGILFFACLWELAGARPWRAMALRLPGASSAAWRDRFGARDRLVRAGLDGRITVAAFTRLKAVGALAGFALGLAIAAPGPARLLPVVLGGLTAAGFLAPDAYLERAARRRRSLLLAALPDALDLMAVGVASGRTPATLIRELASRGSGPLASELAHVAAELDCGRSQAAVLRGLATRTGAPELGAFAGAIERSRRYGSPLADQLHAQAEALRADERRRLDEWAARAAPKIQLVVAMILVPSALLAIVAAIVAHSGKLVGAF